MIPLLPTRAAPTVDASARAALAARFRNRRPPTWKYPPATVEYRVVLVLVAAVRFSKVRAMIESLHPDLFPTRIYRLAAAMLITGISPDTTILTDSEKGHLHEILREIQRCSLDVDEAWGVYLVKLLSSQRFQPLMADMLRWAADEVAEGRLASERLRKLMMHACDIADGAAPFDPTASWEVA